MIRARRAIAAALRAFHQKPMALMYSRKAEYDPRGPDVSPARFDALLAELGRDLGCHVGTLLQPGGYPNEPIAFDEGYCEICEWRPRHCAPTEDPATWFRHGLRQGAASGQRDERAFRDSAFSGTGRPSLTF